VKDEGMPCSMGMLIHSPTSFHHNRGLSSAPHMEGGEQTAAEVL
jgi:hypothetical protein